MKNKLAIISDLHLEHWKRYYPNSTFESLFKMVYDKCMAHKPDYVIIAGDIHDGFVQSGFDLEKNIIFTPGNHDYWYCPWPTKPNIALVDDNITTATLWTNFRGWYTDSEARDACTRIFQGINDARLILDVDFFKLGQHADFTLEHIKNNPTEIVVTHFPPSIQSIAPRYLGDMFTPYFVNDMEDEVKDLPIKLWVAGHVHHKHSYYMNKTLVICNPLAYPYEQYNSIEEYEPVIVEKINDEWIVQNE